jgi:hypothetical protein
MRVAAKPKVPLSGLRSHAQDISDPEGSDMEQKNTDIGPPAPEAGRSPACGRLLARLGIGAELAVIPGGLVLVVQAEHPNETVRLGDLEERVRRAA